MLSPFRVTAPTKLQILLRQYVLLSTSRWIQRRWCTVTLAAALATQPLFGQAHKPVDVWRTSADRTELLSHTQLAAQAKVWPGSAESIVIDPKARRQPVEGFGFAMTGGSAQLLHGMSPASRQAILKELFGGGQKQLGISYLRISIGASDMNDHVYTYDDVADGQIDSSLAHFSLAEDEADLIPILREVLAISPHLRILASPWTAPSWMKTNGAPKGGTLRTEYYDAYAHYLVRYLREMQAHGIAIDALTLENEPLNPKNTPSMVLDSAQEETLLRDFFGPALRASGLKTKVILFDHNCNHPDYPLAILRDPAAAQFATGSGFHLYEGDISAMSEVHDAVPSKGLYFTEQMVVEHITDGHLDPVARPVARVVIGAMRNWSRTVLLWNLAADEHFGPHTNEGGCPVCQGAITIQGDTVTRNIALYTIAHASKFVPPGSVRLDSTQDDPELSNVAWQTPSGKAVLLVANTGAARKDVKVTFGSTSFLASVDPGSTATFVW